MRVRLLEATLDALAELGWAGTTTIEVCRRAKVSRGAQLHHFPSRADLILGAASYLVQISLRALRAMQTEVAGEAPGEVLRAVAGLYESREFVAGIELRLASRPDPALRVTVDELVGVYAAALRGTVDDLLRIGSDPQRQLLLRTLLDCLQGYGVRRMTDPTLSTPLDLIDCWVGWLGQTRGD